MWVFVETVDNDDAKRGRKNPDPRGTDVQPRYSARFSRELPTNNGISQRS